MPEGEAMSDNDFRVIHGKSTVFYDKYDRKADLQHMTHYCPGCGHGVVHKLIAEALEEFELQDRTVFVSPVGCSVFGYYYFDVGNVQAAHGRAPAVATGIKRSQPESIVISYQGDGDLAAIGTAEIIHAANRGESINVFFVNNAIYGMTGGQMAPTTLVGQKSTTSPFGRRVSNEGFPMRMAELMSQLEAPVYVERVSLNDAKNLMKARKAIRKAIQIQRDKAGFTFVEILSPCPTIWKKSPQDSRAFIKEEMIPIFPLKLFKDRKLEAPGDGGPPVRSVAEVLGLDKVAPGSGKPRTGSGEEHHRPTTVKVAGFGGQGILLLGMLLAETGMREGFNVSWLPAYGPEMRSGSANCHVCLSDERIGSPLLSEPEVLIAMNEPSLRKYGPTVAGDGLILYNQDALPEKLPAPQARTLFVPASEIADGLGSAKVANIVMMGALLAETDCLPEETAIAVLEETITNAKLLELDRKALKAGAEFIRKSGTPAGS
jgi:2-oxoisovalerate ferredoxin oxidoreductase beta subunit